MFGIERVFWNQINVSNAAITQMLVLKNMTELKIQLLLVSIRTIFLFVTTHILLCAELQNMYLL